MKHKNVMDILFTYLALCAVIALLMLVWALNEGAEVFGFYLFGAVFGLVQLPFCFKSKRVAVKLIPVYLIVLILVVALINYLQGGLGGELAALILAIGALILAIGAVVAWLTFAICHIRMKKEKV
jgi:hypothetical protein